MKNVFIIGSKGIPAKYGGFETFVEFLTKMKKSKEFTYHVSCMASNTEIFNYNNARCFNINVPNIGSAKAVLYDIQSLRACIKYIKKNNLQGSIVYILACRIGPVFSFYKKTLEKMGAKVYVNPDGHEWKRSKWNRVVRKYWKVSEMLMVKHADLLICDSRGIESYIKKEYFKYTPKTKFISYGAKIHKSRLLNNNTELVSWYKEHNLKPNNYYLIVGRFVPENNYELMIKKFIKSKTKKDLVIISNVEQNTFYQYLEEETGFAKDSRIKFVGTLYNQDLLQKVRENAYAYLHGHEVGGTNPSLLEAMASTKLNLLLDVVFNKEVGGNGALYFSKHDDSLIDLINKVDSYPSDKVDEMGILSKERISKYYSWENIISEYEDLFTR